MSPQFKRRLRRAVVLYIREMQDGCVDCIELKRRRRGVMCGRCAAVACDVEHSPAKYVTVRPDTPCHSSAPRPTA